jgi:hypothetical protein
LALNRAEAGDFNGAQALFGNRFFPRQEGGTNVRQVWIEVKTMQALSLANANQCEASVAIAEGLEKPVAGLDFTKEGLSPFVRSARTQYLLGEADRKCGRMEQAQARWRSASQSGAAQEFVWARRAARKLPGYDESKWSPRTESALSSLTSRLESMSQKGFWAYALGLLEQELGKQEAGRAHLTRAVLLPDRMLSLHLSRFALQDAEQANRAKSMSTQAAGEKGTGQ